MLSHSRMSAGREFQVDGAATEQARVTVECPQVESSRWMEQQQSKRVSSSCLQNDVLASRLLTEHASADVRVLSDGA